MPCAAGGYWPIGARGYECGCAGLVNRPPDGAAGNVGFDAGGAKPLNNDVAGVGDGAPGNRPPVAGGPNREPPAAGAVVCGGAKAEGPGPKNDPPGGALVVGAGDGEVLGPNVAADWLRASPPLLVAVAVVGVVVWYHSYSVCVSSP